VPLTFDDTSWRPFVPLAGLSLEVGIEAGDTPRGHFVEDLLFTHRGLSGPAILQVSLYWRAPAPIRINLAPGTSLDAALAAAKHKSRRNLVNELATLVPRRLAEAWLATQSKLADRPMPEMRDSDLTILAGQLQRWEVTPTGTEGYKKAEVTAGGVDTRELSSQTLMSLHVPGLYFIGEVVDVTGWLGGYNFQWAWASAAACARALQR